MSRSLLVLFLVAAGAAVVLLFVVGGGAGGSLDVDRGGAEGDRGDLEGLDPAADGDDASRVGDAPVVLFGRPDLRRPGKGVVTGIVANAQTGGPVTDAELLLSGKSYEGKDVLVRVRSDAEGRFTHGGLPAGEGYVLKVVAKDLPGRTLGGIDVATGQVTELGKIWIGKSGVITGRVFDAEGRGLGRADVHLFPGMGSWMDLVGDMVGMMDRLDEEPVPLARTKTYSDGAFELEGVDPGTWTVIATARGYEPAVEEVTVTGAVKPDVMLRVAEADVLRGIVVDGQSRPIANARVAAVASQSPFSFLYGRRFAVTGPDGVFEVDMARGSQGVSLMAAAEGYPTHMTPVKEGEREVRIVLDRGCRLTIELLALPDDEPVAGTALMVAVSDATTFGQQGAGSMAYARTDAEGKAQVDVSTGRIQIVWVTHPVSGSSMWMPAMTRMPFGLKGPEDTDLPAGERTITLRMPKQQVVVGTVRGPKGEPVVGASVSSLFSVQIGGTPAISDADGRYRFHAPDFPGGAVALRVTAPGYVQDMSTLSATGKKPDANGEIQHDLKMNRAAVIQGRVLGSTKKPLAGVRVKYNAELGAAMMGGLAGSGETLTGEDGTYILEDIQPRTGASVIARAAGYVDAVSEKFETKSGELTEAPDLVLKKGARVLVLVEGPDGRPLSKAKIEYSFDRSDDANWDFMEMFMTDRTLAADANGRVEVTNVPVGTATFTVTHDDHASAKTSVEVKDGEDEHVVTVRARRARTVAGTVVDPDGRAIAGALVRVTDPTTQAHVGSAHTSSSGRFEIPRVPEGAVEIHVSADGFVRRTVGAVDASSIRLERMAYDAAQRIAEIQRLMMEKNQALLEADNAAERQALSQEISQLSEELNRLQGESK